MSDMDAHLLIVDDDERIRDLLKKFLMRNGFLVTAARDAAHARRVLEGLDFPVHSGGPVGRDSMQFVHRLPEAIRQSADSWSSTHEFPVEVTVVGSVRRLPTSS